MKTKIYVLLIVLFGVLFISNTFAQVDVPEGLKNIVPIYEGSKVIHSMQMQGASQALFEVQASPKEIISYYKSIMQQRGWKIVVEMDMENTSMTNLSKDDASLVINAAANKGEKTMLQILLKMKD
jgi:hypothetical protein